jgi:hypothetical protein
MQSNAEVGRFMLKERDLQKENCEELFKYKVDLIVCVVVKDRK